MSGLLLSIINNSFVNTFLNWIASPYATIWKGSIWLSVSQIQGSQKILPVHSGTAKQFQAKRESGQWLSGIDWTDIFNRMSDRRFWRYEQISRNPPIIKDPVWFRSLQDLIRFFGFQAMSPTWKFTLPPQESLTWVCHLPTRKFTLPRNLITV